MAAPRSATQRSFVGETIAHEPVRGILLLIFAVCTFSLLDTTAKYLVQSYPIGQVVWARYVGHVVLAAALLLPLHGRGLLVTPSPGLQVLRPLFLFGSPCATFPSPPSLQLAEPTPLLFSPPFHFSSL